MEELSVASVVKANKANNKAFGAFMTERIVRPDGGPSKILSQFLAEERLEGRYPLRGNGREYRPLKEEVIIVAPKAWGATNPSDLVGALVGVTVIGTIPIIKDNRKTMEIIVVRLTDPDGTAPADFVRAGWAPVVETEVYLGRDTWVDYPPGIPSAFPEESEPEEEAETTSDPTPDDDDDEGYW